MKFGVRIIGIDDSPFKKFEKGGKVLIVGVVQRRQSGGGLVEGILSTYVTKDANDATDKILEMIIKSRFYPQIHFILLNGIMIAGLNVVDINRLYSKSKIPVIALTRKKPNKDKVIEALKKNVLKKNIVDEIKEKIEIIKKTENPHEIIICKNKFFVQTAGVKISEVENLLKNSGLGPLRLAHLIGSGIVKGESSGRI